MKHAKLMRRGRVWSLMLIVCFIFSLVPTLTAQNAAGVGTTIGEEPGPSA
ncbi:MAG: hypothetical protein HY584_05640, partial [Candidatus Omnitrophica bacterium]|nr:hypothetical protein [Candidatus Omnitrophota bacterium]